MSDLSIGTRNIGTQQLQGLGTKNTPYVWGEGTNDLILGQNKDFIQISGETKLQQDIIKVLMTDRSTNSIYPVYGSTIRQVIGSKSDFNLIKNQIKSIVIEALAVLQFLNKDNSDSNEQISVINIVKVTVPESGEIDVSIQVTTKGGTVVNTVLNF
jgi:hypothetical protein